MSLADAEWVIANPTRTDLEEDGKRHSVGCIRGERVRVVVAFDDPELVVTIHRRRR